MATIDVRNEEEEVVDTIVFAETHESVTNVGDAPLAYQIVRDEEGSVSIRDIMDVVFVSDKQHALNLIKAINKAIELGWLR